MFRCSKCNGPAKYDFKERVFLCKNDGCGAVEPVTYKQRHCVRCGHPYIEYTWFDPSGCPKCGKSYVE